MKCPTCEAQGTRSIVYVGPVATTNLASSSFYDEDGRYHMHDPNTTTHEYACSLGHRWVQQGKVNRCWCEMLNKADIKFGPIDEPSENVAPPATTFADSYSRLFGYPEDGK